MNPKQIFVREATGLVKDLSAADAYVLNMANMGIGWLVLFAYVIPALYPGAHMAGSALIALPFSLLVAANYFIIAVVMPRTGGDYVFVSRVLHPALGFLTSFWYVVMLLSAIGINAVWAWQLGLSPMLWTLGTATGNSAMISTGQVIGTPEISAVLASIWIILVMLVLFTRKSRPVVLILACLAVLGVLMFAVTLLASSSANFSLAFEAATKTTVDKIISSAQESGYLTGFTATGTVLGIVYSVLGYAGYVQSAYFAAEIKGAPQKSQLIGIFGSLLTVGALTVVCYAAIYQVIGADLWHALSYDYASGNPAYPLPVPPMLQVMLMFVTSNPIILFLVGFALLSTCMTGPIAYTYMASRIIFAWSFDRLAPSKFADLHPRFNCPYLIYILAGLVGVASVLIFTYTPLFSYMAYQTTIYPIIYIIAGLAVALFPYRRREWFRNAPPLARRTVGGIPAISILGALVVITNLIVAYASLTPALLGAPINPVYVTVVVVVSIIGVGLYYLSYLNNKRRGIDLSLVYKELPPE